MSHTPVNVSGAATAVVTTLVFLYINVNGLANPCKLEELCCFIK
jgi:hypothetical protein